MPIDLAPTHYFVVNPAGSTADGSAVLHDALRKEMPWQRPLPQRLRIALNLGVLCCFIAAGLLIAWIRASSVATQAQDQLHAEARAVAAGMAMALEQRDRLDMRGLLESMVHRRDFAAVAIHDAAGNRIAAYAKSRNVLTQLPTAQAAATIPTGFLVDRFPATLVLREPVRSASATLGTLVLYADLGARWQAFYAEMSWICAALLLSLLLCAALVNLVQQHIAEPVYRLERTCRVIVEDRDYTLRAWKAARDEIGTVVDCVNHLLDEVHRRGAALVEARGQIAQALTAAPVPAAAPSQDSQAWRSQFISNMCHEIRTPLNRAGALCRDLEATALTPTQRELVSSVHATGDLVIALLDDLLDYTRLESGKLEMQTVEFDPLEVLETVVRMYGERAQAKRLTLTIVRTPGTPSRAKGDRARLRQIVGALVGNAIKYAQSGEICVMLGAQEVDATGCNLRIDVLDSGFGIAEEARQRVHDALTQNLQGQAAPSGSAALGLTIANHLIQRMGGTLSLCEAEGGRAGFSFSVRVEAASGSPEQSTAPATAAKAQTTAAPPRAIRSRRAGSPRGAETKRRTERDRVVTTAPDLATQVTEVYLDSAPELFESLRVAISQGAPEDIKDASHVLGACSARVGANQVADLCHAIEELAVRGDLAPLPKKLEELQGAFERARTSLARESTALADKPHLSPHSLSTTLQ